jgi:hypothetical protein
MSQARSPNEIRALARTLIGLDPQAARRLRDELTRCLYQRKKRAQRSRTRNLVAHSRRVAAQQRELQRKAKEAGL